MKKIALINQRYGLEVNGGSEYYTRLLAEKLNGRFEVEVLTTTALGYDTWENYYSEGVENIEGVTVRRFRVDHPRDVESFNRLTDALSLKADRTPEEEKQWVEAQGPVCSGLLNYISGHEQEYDLFIFVTYLYYLTVRGLPKLADKAILIPTAHDEPYIYFSVYRDVFLKPRGIVYLTEEEKDFVERTGVDVLAIAFGTTHGIYTKKPKLDLERITKIKDAVDIPFVMHGGSGLSKEEFQTAIRNGIRKINYYTYMTLAGGRAVKEALDQKSPDENVFFHDIPMIAVEAMKENVKEAIQVFGMEV